MREWNGSCCHFLLCPQHLPCLSQVAKMAYVSWSALVYCKDSDVLLTQSLFPLNASKELEKKKKKA